MAGYVPEWPWDGSHAIYFLVFCYSLLYNVYYIFINSVIWELISCLPQWKMRHYKYLKEMRFQGLLKGAP